MGNLVVPQLSSATWNHPTPADIVSAARWTLGAIDLDPATSPEFNQRIRAERFFTAEDDGLSLKWRGRVFLNPPGGSLKLPAEEKDAIEAAHKGRSKAAQEARKEALAAARLRYSTEARRWGTRSRSAAWWRKLAEEFDSGRVRAAIFIGFTLEILRSGQDELGNWSEPFDHALCFPRGRLEFEGADPTHANVIVYLGGHRNRFRTAFEKFGRVVS